MLPRTDIPLILDFDTVIEDESEAPLACPIPPRLDPNEPAAVTEARGLRAAYDRAVERIGTTQVGRVVDADGIPDAIGAFIEVADGAPWNEVDYAGGHAATLLMDIRAYYEEAALGLSDGVPAARSASPNGPERSWCVAPAPPSSSPGPWGSCSTREERSARC